MNDENHYLTAFETPLFVFSHDQGWFETGTTLQFRRSTNTVAHIRLGNIWPRDKFILFDDAMVQSERHALTRNIVPRELSYRTA